MATHVCMLACKAGKKEGAAHNAHTVTARPSGIRPNWWNAEFKVLRGMCSGGAATAAQPCAHTPPVTVAVLLRRGGNGPYQGLPLPYTRTAVHALTGMVQARPPTP